PAHLDSYGCVPGFRRPVVAGGPPGRASQQRSASFARGAVLRISAEARPIGGGSPALPGTNCLPPFRPARAIVSLCCVTGAVRDELPGVLCRSIPQPPRENRL